MSLPVPTKPAKPPKIQFSDVSNWLSGVVTLLDDGRTPSTGLRSSSNVMLEQDGVIRPRPSLQKFGPQPLGTVLGELYEFRVLSGLSFTNWLISMQNVAGTTNIYIAKPEDSTWTKCSASTTYDNSAKAHFVQLDKKVVILNGVDEISYLDIPTSTITTFNALTNPAAPTLTTNTGLTGTNFTVYYAVTANSSVGETSGSQLAVSVSTDRDLWDPTTQSIKIGWTTVTGVKSWNIYAAVSADGSSNPVWGLLASGLSASTLSFTDTGNNGSAGATGPLNTFRTLPTQNSTAGPKASRGEVINGQLWLTGDSANPYFVWHDGGANFQLDFTVANGGGFASLGNGSREIPVRVWNFRSGQGNPEIKVLTQGLNGNGTRYTLTPETISYGGVSATVWAPSEDYGSSGTDSPDGLIVYNNSSYYPSRDGFKELGTKPQLQNLLDDDSVSQTILPDLGLINYTAMDGCVGVGFEGRLYWALPVGSDSNNEIWVLDLIRGGAWMKPLTIDADWLCLIADNDGLTHQVIVNSDGIFELSYNTFTVDDGIAFPTSGSSGIIRFSPDGEQWGRLIELIITLQRAQGKIAFTLEGYTINGKVEPLDSAELDLEVSQTNLGVGWGEGGWGSFGWSDFNTVTDITVPTQQDVILKANRDVKYYLWSWSSAEPNTDYGISRAVAEYINVGIKNLNP